MAQCVLVGSGGESEQLGIYPIDVDGRPMGDVICPEGMTEIYTYLFKDNTKITSVKLPETLIEVSSNAFYNCSNLSNIYIPESTTEIGSYAFQNCSKLSEINIPASVVTFGNGCFDSSGLQKATFNTTDDSLVIAITQFEDCNKLTEVIIPENVTSIELGQAAFANCTALTDETVNSIIKRISSLGLGVFEGCTGLINLSSKYCWREMFSGCTGLKTITINGVASSGASGREVFYNCTNLESISYGDKAMNNMTAIDIYYCKYCSSLKTIVIPPNVTTIGQEAFSRCTSLSNILISDNAKFSISTGCFEYCHSLTDADVMNLISHSSSIGGNTFRYCEGLNNVEITLNSSTMFGYCPNLQSIKIHSCTEIVGSAFAYCPALVEVEIGEGITTIGTGILRDCTALKKITLPSTITTAKNSCLTSTSTSYYFLNGCTALEEVVLGQDWNMALRLNVSGNLTVDSMVAMFNSLKDLTGETAKTLTLGSVNLAKLTDEQKAIATNKNWTLA